MKGMHKPVIHLCRETFFITSDEHLRPHTGRYQTMACFRARNSATIIFSAGA